MMKFAIFLHQNQLLKVRNFQDSLCNFLLKNGILCAPVFPVMIQNENLDSKSKINSISICRLNSSSIFKNKYKKNEILSLNTEIDFGNTKEKGGIEIIQILKDSEKDNSFDFDKSSLSEFENSEIFSSLKRISPFMICEIEINRTEKSSEWKILSQKWEKTPR